MRISRHPVAVKARWENLVKHHARGAAAFLARVAQREGIDADEFTSCVVRQLVKDVLGREL
jgi:hypothetical protein